MKNTRSRSMMVLVLTLAFFAGLIYHAVNLILHSSEWASMPTNAHLTDTGGLAFAGTIFDRNGVVLAESVDRKRVYNSDEEIRKACLHLVGDDSTNISTAVQTLYRSELSDYNFIQGLGVPDSMKRGRDMTLTIDSELQKTALRALGGYKGAMVFYNYKTGEIMCMVSAPTYDPANVPEDIETNDDYEGAYLNRALSAAYAPGSTFKLVTASAALAELSDAEQITHYCEGSEIIGDKEVVCYQASGEVDLKNALADSCNIFFGHLAVSLGKDNMTHHAEKAGFNRYRMVDGARTARSVYDVKEASENDLAWSGVGQYTVLETPLNMAMISAAIANGGTPVKPYFIQKMEGVFGTAGKEGKTELDEPIMSRRVAEKMTEMMAYTVSVGYGKDYVSPSLNVCAKTGTAEVGDGRAHAWITGFCQDEDCPLAFSVIVEYGDSGYSVAIPAAREVLEKAAERYHR